jgi:hypothetical protein
LKASKPQTIQAGDRNKFLPLTCSYAPFSIPAWSAALQAVDQSPSHFIGTSQASGHFTFPDPGIFANQATAAKYLRSWLQIREAWLMRMEMEPSLAMSNQTWRTFLAMDANAPEKEGTKAARRRQESFKLLMPKSETYPELKLRSSTGSLVWQGKEHPAGKLPPDDVVRQILWELYELNFAHELLSLDRRACADLNLSNAEQLLERQIKISRCFHVGSFRHISIPLENHGLASDVLGSRYQYIKALLLVMKSWKGEKPLLITASDEQLREFNRPTVQHAEKVVAKYYCQQFFNYFGRAAQIPHRLFATDATDDD